MLRRQVVSPLIPVLFLLLAFELSASEGSSADAASSPDGAYTQSGVSFGLFNTVPMGHEWVTRMAAIELLGAPVSDFPDIKDPKDPRPDWKQDKIKARGLAKNSNLDSNAAKKEAERIRQQLYPDDSRYKSLYKPVFDAIIGERWVDIAGYNVATSNTCWDNVAQLPAEVQYDHYLRRYDDRGGSGGVNAATGARQRFVDSFVAAAIAPPTMMQVWDGGFVGSARVTADRNYFLLGRAMHILQDSFSPEHTVRLPDDSYTRVRQVKSYVCTAGSEQHTHKNSKVADYSSGDVVWKLDASRNLLSDPARINPTWVDYKASNMKPDALVATEATKDVWAAFIRTMGVPLEQRESVARNEAATLANDWLSFDQNEMLSWYDDPAHRDDTYVLAEGQTGKGRSVQDCMKDLDVGTTDQMAYIGRIKATQRECLYNAVPRAGYSDLFDTSMHIWYSWRWRNGPDGALLPPSDDWRVPDRPADNGVRVRIKSTSNGHGQYMTAPDGIADENWVYCKPGTEPLDFILVRNMSGDLDAVPIRLSVDPMLFLDYRDTTGAVKLFNYCPTLGPLAPPCLDYTPTTYRISPAGAGWSIYSNARSQYMWLNSWYQSPYIDSDGNPANRNAQWIIEGLSRK